MDREGRIMEKPFRMGESIAGENVKHEGASTPFHTLSVENEMHLALSSAEANGAQEMKELGLDRARKYGWQDTYVFTKAMGEMLLGSMGGDVPVVILQPSIIESTYRDPFPGWMEGNRMIDPVVVYYGKGHLLGFLGDPNVVLDMVPVDMVVNAALAAIAKHGASGKPEITVYHVSSSAANPLAYKDLANLVYQHFAKLPCLDSKGNTIQVKPFKFYNSIGDFLSQGRKEMEVKVDSLTATAATNVSTNADLSRKLEKICRKLTEQAKKLASLYEPYAFYGGRYTRV